MSFAYILVEHSNGDLDPVTAELITAGRAFGVVSAVVVGTPGTAAAFTPQLAEWGAAQIVAAETPSADSRVVIPATDALSILAGANPAPLLIAAGVTGNEIAGRLAARLASGALYDVVGVNADGTAAMSIFGDTVAVTAAASGNSPIYTLRPGAVDAAPEAAAGELVALELPDANATEPVVTGFTPAERGNRPDLAQAKVVVAGGRGVGSAEGFTDIVEPLADALGGAVGVTRDVVDSGYYPGQFQIGQTGVTVSPDLYIGLGVSGAIQHKSGMQTAKKIIVINNDEDAPLFEIADLGVAGGDRRNLCDLRLRLDLLRLALDLLDKRLDSRLDALLDDHRVCARNDVAHAFLNHGLCQESGRRRAGTRHIVCFRGNFLNELSAHVLSAILQIYISGNCYTIVCNKR